MMARTGTGRVGTVGMAALAARVLLAAGAAPALAQVQPPQERINLALARAREVGIPVALLESKLAEGKAKGVSLERIAAVIERREATLERVATMLRGRPDIQPADLSVSADAIESGISEAVLKAVADSAPRERRAVAIAALTQLVELGHTPAAALERVRDALKRGPEVLANLAAQGGNGRGRGTGAADPSGGRGRGTPGPPAAVPAPGEPSQPSRPGGGSQGRGSEGRGSQGRGQGEP